MKDVFKTFGVAFAYAAGITAGFVVGTNVLGEKLCDLSKKLVQKKEA